jgi:hypothetical protein
VIPLALCSRDSFFLPQIYLPVDLFAAWFGLGFLSTDLLLVSQLYFSPDTSSIWSGAESSSPVPLFSRAAYTGRFGIKRFFSSLPKLVSGSCCLFFRVAVCLWRKRFFMAIFFYGCRVISVLLLSHQIKVLSFYSSYGTFMEASWSHI